MLKLINMKQRVSPGDFSIIFATAFVEVKNWRLHGCCIICFDYVRVLPEVRKPSKQ